VAITATSAVRGEILKSFDELTSEELEDKVARAAATAESYRLTSVERRAGWVVKDSRVTRRAPRREQAPRLEQRRRQTNCTLTELAARINRRDASDA
jgi:hypothetical protein